MIRFLGRTCRRCGVKFSVEETRINASVDAGVPLLWPCPQCAKINRVDIDSPPHRPQSPPPRVA